MFENKVQLAFSTEAVTFSCVWITTPQTDDEDQVVIGGILEISGEVSAESSQDEAIEEMNRFVLPPLLLFSIEVQRVDPLAELIRYLSCCLLQKKSNAVYRATMLHWLGPTVQWVFSTLLGENTTLKATKEALKNWVQIYVNNNDNYNTVRHHQTKLHNHEFSNILDVEMNCHHHHHWTKDQQTLELHDAGYCLTIQMVSP